jgi:hypothetical protein
MHADCALLLDSDAFVAACDDEAVFIVVPTAAARDTEFSVAGIERGRLDSAHEFIAATRMDSLRDSMRGMELLDDSASCVLRSLDVEDVEVSGPPCWMHALSELRQILHAVKKA